MGLGYDISEYIPPAELDCFKPLTVDYLLSLGWKKSRFANEDELYYSPWSELIFDSKWNSLQIVDSSVSKPTIEDLTLLTRMLSK